MSDILSNHLIKPLWPAPARVKAIQTTRIGGVSAAPYDALNLAMHVKDRPENVARNRQLLSRYVPTEPVWMNQTHSTRVIDAAKSSCIENADASFTTQPNVVCVTMTADCLPVLLCDVAGTVVAAVHAGWRGLCDGVIEATIADMPVESAQLIAWLGPAIGPNAFEVGDEVREQFVSKNQQAEVAFVPKADKWLGNLYQIATQRLQSAGVNQIYGDVDCTYSNPERFFSFRRDHDTGRMATLIWIAG